MKDRGARSITGIVGIVGCGKSTVMANIIKHSKDPNALIYKDAGNLDDKAFRGFPVKGLYQYAGGKVIVSNRDLDRDKDVAYKKFLQLIYPEDGKGGFRNGQLVIDDARLYEKYKLSDGMIDLMQQRRHSRIDIYMIYHGFEIIPVQFWDYCDNVIIFNTIPSMRKATKLDLPDEVEASMIRVRQKAQTNPFYKEMVKLAKRF